MTPWNDKYEALDENQRAVIDEIVESAIETITSDRGAVVVLSDPKGNGRANFLYGGNTLLIEGLLEAGAEIGKEYFVTDRSAAH